MRSVSQSWFQAPIWTTHLHPFQWPSKISLHDFTILSSSMTNVVMSRASNFRIFLAIDRPSVNSSDSMSRRAWAHSWSAYLATISSHYHFMMSGKWFGFIGLNISYQEDLLKGDGVVVAIQTNRYSSFTASTDADLEVHSLAKWLSEIAREFICEEHVDCCSKYVIVTIKHENLCIFVLCLEYFHFSVLPTFREYSNFHSILSTYYYCN